VLPYAGLDIDDMANQAEWGVHQPAHTERQVTGHVLQVDTDERGGVDFVDGGKNCLGKGGRVSDDILAALQDRIPS
jgi:hypothetical protein